MTKPVRCVILDLDGTLYPATMGLLLLEGLIATGMCDPTKVLRLQDFLNNKGPDDRYEESSVLRAYHLYAQIISAATPPQLRRIAHQVWNRAKCDLFPYVRPMLDDLHAEGYLTLLISGSPHEIVEPVATDLGISRFQGAVFAVRNGKYTGSIQLATGVPGRKSGIISQLLGKLAPDLSQTIAVGNSIADIDVLQSVGKPIAFEPSTILREVATTNTWPIADRENLPLLINNYRDIPKVSPAVAPQ